MTKHLLELLGWNSVIKYKGLHPFKKPFVGCLSHTAGNYEFFLYWLYTQTDKNFKNFCLVMADNPNFHKQPFKSILSKVNLILLSKERWNSSQNYVKKIVDEVIIKKYKYLILAPSGKDKQALPWKRGYYYIAKNLGWDFRVVGFDFESKRLKIGSLIKLVDNPQKEIEILLQKEMGDIVPLRTKNSFVAIRDHNNKNISFIDRNALLIPSFILITCITIIFYLRSKANKTITQTIFHLLLSLYGLVLLFNDDITINLIGLSIIYQHLAVIYLQFPRIPKDVIITGAFVGVIIGISKNNKMLYVPLLYSFFSKVPSYATNSKEQYRAISLVIICSIIVQKFQNISK